ncbi:hypothetical protein CLV82_0505 [Zeaxanthinibacter enoshimensis]|uniref:Uncharacterized protein n=1 Tax=Zeaxanthinibacter enoshimensis TaxID=392009 RepID=A0A4R6TMC9_9FLAO|nr:hypothetical protein CLV82_0505 [Zeaxanthinibacter enoshimensis]
MLGDSPFEGGRATKNKVSSCEGDVVDSLFKQ